MKNNKELIIVDGLPYSGKTEYIDEHYSSVGTDYIDTKFIQNGISNTEDLIKALVDKMKFSLKGNNMLILESVILNNQHLDQILEPIKNKFPKLNVTYIWQKTDMYTIKQNIAQTGMESIAYNIVLNTYKEIQDFHPKSKYIDNYIIEGNPPILEDTKVIFDNEI